MRLVAAAIVGFVVIGTVEGFISPGSYFPWPVNLTVGLSLLGLFIWWVRSAGRNTSASATTASSAR